MPSGLARALLDLAVVEGVEQPQTWNAESGAPRPGAASVGSPWFTLLQHAQKGNILKHLASRRVDRSEFVAALLESLDDQTRSDSIHAQVLQLLAEWSDVLLAPPEDPSETIAHLISKCTTMMSDRMKFKAKLISTITTLILVHDYTEKGFQSFINFNMLSVLAGDDVVETALLRRIVCHCLIDLELAMPGLLSHKLGHIYQLAQTQTTITAQAYAQLLAVVMRNACAVLRIQSTHKWRADILSRVPPELVASHRLNFQSLLSVDDEALTPFFFPPEVLDGPLPLSSFLARPSPPPPSSRHAHDTRRSAPNTPQRRGAAKPSTSAATTVSAAAVSSSAASTVVPESAIVGPPGILAAAQPVESKQAGEDAIQRCVSFLSTAASNATAPSMAHTLHALATLLSQTNLSNQVFHVTAKRLELSVDHCDIHALLMLLSIFQQRRLLRTKEIVSVRVRLLDLILDPQVPKWRRQLLFTLCFCNRMLLGKHKTIEDFFPREFESIEMWTRQVDMLASVVGLQAMARIDSDRRSEHSDSRSTITDTSLRLEVLPDMGALSTMSPDHCLGILRSALDCFQTYMFADSLGISAGARAFFATVYRILVHAPPPVTQDVSDYLLRLVASQPAFLPLLVNTVTAVSETLGDTTLATAILRKLQDRFVATEAQTLMQHIDDYLVLVLRLAQVEGIAPATFLLKLKEILTSTAICRRGEWNRGNRLLQICRCIMQRNVTEASTLLPLGDVLTTIWQSYRNIDIQDLARLLYMLLVKVSGARLESVLETSLDDLEQGRIQAFLPADDVDRTRRDHEGIFKATHQLLILKRIKPKQVRKRDTKYRMHVRKPSLTSLERVMTASSSNDPVDEPLELPPVDVDVSLRGTLDADGVLKAYAKHVQANMAQASVRLPCRLSYEVAAGVAKIVRCPEKVFAIQLNLHDDAGHFRETEPVYIPCLRLFQRSSMSTGDDADDMRDGAAVGSGVRTFWDFELPCHPVEPRPADLHATVTYTDDSGASWRSKVDDIHVAFTDLLQQPSLPSGWMYRRAGSDEGMTARPEGEVNAYREVLFGALWRHVGANADASGVVSSKSLDMSAAEAVAFLRKHFQRFMVVARKSDKQGELARLQILIFVPPQYHILLDCQVLASRTLVHIASDHLLSASHLERLLHDEMMLAVGDA
ncbi:hypothetical protein PTSG_12048 [Salpingoeca rosetta]|uniref:Uncharacterized protein n=1 Tax=Salpingoeca rosetta (strain ATCC 50818 / BSB-021) TaxID=946362 RepID=F2U658_SALR5|nr:uncharacterized protein PTSG_12048 [Salpingoeca rosetta]EGD82999.1 hypothetical protein PTSG_12048 [Salpingoeca rosetta]|eukprot:XP_004995363.1 hypothetical protein PTSG_12048 [Salpingoeca rosetta]